MTRSPFFALLIATTMMTACVPVGIATGVGATAGIAAGQEGGLKAAVSDTAIRARINDYWFKYDTEMFSKVQLTVDQGRVLLTGVVQKPEHRVEAVRLAWQAKGVKQVINEIQVGNTRSLGTYTRDKWITGEIRTQMIFTKNIQSINYTIDTIKGVVYLMGVAQDQAELDRVIRLVQKVKGVKQVVSYVKMVGEKIIPAEKGSTTEGNSGLGPAPVTSTSTSGTYDSNGVNMTGAAPIVPSSSDIQSEQLPP